jgi:hypothetical protein
MRMHMNSVLASLAVMSLTAKGDRVIDVSDDHRETQPPATPRPNYLNRPGETNRQFAARMKAAAARQQSPEKEPGT